MSLPSRLVVVEFVADTDKRKAGERLAVDAVSATSLCDHKKVAVRVDDKPPAAPAPSVDVVDYFDE